MMCLYGYVQLFIRHSTLPLQGNDTGELIKQALQAAARDQSLTSLKIAADFDHEIEDLDKCSPYDSVSQCHANAECNTSKRPYVCQCVKGYSGNGTHCEGKID